MSAPLTAADTAEPTDAQLVMLVLNGDDGSYATLVRRHQQQIYRHARGMGLDHDTSLDLVQEAFVKAFDHLEDCRDGANYRSWLFRICRNLCLDELRDVRRRCVPMSAIENADDVEDTRASTEGWANLTIELKLAGDGAADVKGLRIKMNSARDDKQGPDENDETGVVMGRVPNRGTSVQSKPIVNQVHGR